MSHPQDLPLREQATGIAAGDIDPAELLQLTFERIEQRDEPLNSVVARFPEEAERMLADAPRGPLYGVPVAIKDMYRLPFWAPRDGSEHEQAPAGESGVFRALRDAGAVVVGVTQMHLYGGGTTGHASAYGPVGNPWDPARCAGGSSGGSAAAVGARLVAGAVGTDGGGSVRIPAAYCGVTGLKATFGAVPREGFTHAFASMVEAGPMARDAADTRLLGETLLGRPLPAGDGAGLRVGVVRDPLWADLDPEVERAGRAALEAAGWSVQEVDLAGSEHILAASILGLTIEVLPAYSPEEMADADPLLRAIAKYQLLISANAYVRAVRVRSQLRRALADAFERCDVLAWPTVPAVAPPIDNPTVERPSGPAPADPGNVHQNGLGNLSGMPSLSVPIGIHSTGVPMGLSLNAAWGRDELLLDAAEHLERATERQHVDAVPPIAA